MFRDYYDETIESIYKKFSSNTNFINEFTIYKEILINCFNKFSEKFKKYADKQKIHYLIVTDGNSHPDSKHAKLGDVIKQNLANCIPDTDFKGYSNENN
ncbi:hypothetical protein COBT_003905 [Conglomerata obtusa]